VEKFKREGGVDLEKPILFSTPMVQAILEGRKTQTRRIVKPQPSNKHSFLGRVIDSTDRSIVDKATFDIDGKDYIYVNVPYEQDDLLWVRETWCSGMARDGGNKIIYKANIEDLLQPMHNWKPSIHMPRSAARLFLKVIKIRIQRLQDITEEDAMAEGIIELGNCTPPDYSLTRKQYSNGIAVGFKTAREAFIDLWDSIYKEQGFEWQQNTWVWVIEFEKQ
jgi:hypothetical protein